MKDLTGLWFKGPLVDVLENSMGKDEVKGAVIALAPHVRRLPVIWKHFFKAGAEVEDAFYGVVADKRPNIFSDLNRNWTPLLHSIEVVCAVLANFMEAWGNGSIPDKQQAWLTLPSREVRGFLDYESAPPWEGRYDTMYPPFHLFAPRTTYLVEHRFN
jgi:hypothetical protein